MKSFNLFAVQNKHKTRQTKGFNVIKDTSNKTPTAQYRWITIGTQEKKCTCVGYDWVACNITWHNPYMEHSNQLTTYHKLDQYQCKGNIIKFFNHFTKEKFYLPFHHDKIFVGNRTINIISVIYSVNQKERKQIGTHKIPHNPNSYVQAINSYLKKLK